MAKFKELWQEVEHAQSERTASGARMAIVEAHKVLEAALEGRGYPGKTVKKKLFWAGYSGKDKEGISEALKKHEEILNNFQYQLSDFESDEIIKIYHKVLQEIMTAPKFGLLDKVKAFSESYLSPKSINFWKYLAIFLGTFIGIKILKYTDLGRGIVEGAVDLADFFISWLFVAIVMVFVAGYIAVNYYLANKRKVRIKED